MFIYERIKFNNTKKQKHMIKYRNSLGLAVTTGVVHYINYKHDPLTSDNKSHYTFCPQFVQYTYYFII